MSDRYLSVPKYIYEDIFSDSLSSCNSGHSYEESSPEFNYPDAYPMDGISDSSKKIRKKRTAYARIDDHQRVQLLEAVQNGETLKGASTRLKINYSSAKSIIHTFKKEGRIFKKNTSGSNYFGFDQLPTTSYTDILSSERFQPSNISANYNHLEHNNFSRNFALRPESTTNHNTYLDSQKPSTHGVKDTFSGLLNSSLKYHEENNLPQVHQTTANPKIKIYSSTENDFSPLNNFQYNQSFHHGPSPSSYIQSQSTLPTISLSCASLNDTFEELRNLETYMNYSNSPLSGKVNPNIYKECSDSSSRRYNKGEFDSFTDMVSAIQGQTRTYENNKIEINNPKPVRLPLQEKVEKCGMNQEMMTNDNYGLMMNKNTYFNKYSQLSSYTGASPMSTWTL